MISKAVTKKANIIANQPYSLPENEQGEYVSSSNFANYRPHELAYLISEACFEADCVEGGSINALEIFVYKDIISVKNSRGIDKTQVKYRAMVEAIPTFNGEESVELYEQYNFTEFEESSSHDISVGLKNGDKMLDVQLDKPAYAWIDLAVDFNEVD